MGLPQLYNPFTSKAPIPQSPFPFLGQIAKIATIGSAWIAQEAYVDSTFSVPCTDGQLVYGLRDVTGGGLNAINATAAQRPAYRDKGFNGRPSVDYSLDTARILTATGTFGASGYTAGFTVYAVINPAQNSPTNTVVWLKDTNYNITVDNNLNSTGVGGIRFSVNGTNVYQPHNRQDTGFLTNLNETLLVIAMSWDGANLTTSINGCRKTTALSGTPPTTGNTSLGNLAGSPPTLGLTGNEPLVFQCPGAHSAATMDQITALLCQEYNIPNVMFFAGDSITQGFGLTVFAEQCFPAQTLKLLGGVRDNNVAYINNGKGGYTIANGITDCGSPELAQMYGSSAHGANSIAVLMFGTNSITQVSAGGDNLTAAQAFAQLKTLVAFYRPIFKYLYLIPIIRRDATNAGGAFEARRVAFNALLASDTTMGVDGIVSSTLLDSGFTLGLSGAGQFQSGDVHPNDSGASFIAWGLGQTVNQARDTSGIFTPYVPTTPALQSARIVGAGTAFNLGTSLAAVTFGTTSPALILPPGTYLLVGGLSFSGGTVADNIQGQFLNSTASAAIGTVHNDTVNLAVGTNISDMAMTDLVTLTVTSTVTMQAANVTGARGTVIAANSYLSATRIA